MELNESFQLCNTLNSLAKVANSWDCLSVLNIHAFEFKMHVVAVFSNIPGNILVL